MVTTAGRFDAVIVGAGIMGTTMAGLLARLEPGWRIAVVERLPEAGLESSNAWNNAGTGHAGLCEFNYTPQAANGSVDISSALAINEQFQISCQYWAHLVEAGGLGEPGSFIRPVPHFSFAHGPAGVRYLRARHAAMAGEPLFAGMEYSEDPAVLAGWLPLMFGNRPPAGPAAVTRVGSGTDVDYGALSRQLLADAAGRGVQVSLGQQVAGLRRDDRGWTLTARCTDTGARYRLNTRYVFLAAGGGTLPLLQQAGVPETRAFGGFPISGRFYRTAKPELVARHRAKVYGHAAEGAPPVSVPHLDTRMVDGRRYLMFGPYGAFSPRFLKHGRAADLPRSVRPANLPTLLSAARSNAGLVAYLVRQILQSPEDRFAELRRFVPDADPADWELITAGQRVQVVKMVSGKGAIAGFGTEVVTSAGGSLAALLGASPGASASVSIVLDVLRSSFPARFAAWQPRLRAMIPSCGIRLNDDPGLARQVRSHFGWVLQLD
ncbi:malate dehydrogenase (quinone) [Arthrobacter mobilis]|uniref:Probable malate:quinone oxidoreductase n=1 Tax=Arthrobacter mobilis TaxID=2724944 RepID=A0A7X6K7V4_9MICC|nr:malate dehydrogenase (quinone) [Arthrobacter mobilis]NKX56798.1 malate dehydrogenase (quinone) [Arthrobacter mobilis]